MTWSERIVTLAVHPEAASPHDVRQLAADLLEARRLLVIAMALMPWYRGGRAEQAARTEWLQAARAVTALDTRPEDGESTR